MNKKKESKRIEEKIEGCFQEQIDLILLSQEEKLVVLDVKNGKNGNVRIGEEKKRSRRKI